MNVAQGFSPAIAQAPANATLTAVPGIKVGHHTLAERPTGCTVVLIESGAVAGVDVRGAAPATRDTDLLNPTKMVERIFGVALSGGQQFASTAAISCKFDHRNRAPGHLAMIPQWGLDRKGSAHSRYARSTKLSTTFFSPAFSNAMVSFLPSIFTTWP